MKKLTRRSFLYSSGALLSSVTLLQRAFGARNTGAMGSIQSKDRDFLLKASDSVKSAASTAKERGIPSWGLGPFVRDDEADHIGAKPDSVFACPISGRIIPSLFFCIPGLKNPCFFRKRNFF